MSSVDPALRWWRRPRVLSVVVTVLWGLALLGAVILVLVPESSVVVPWLWLVAFGLDIWHRICAEAGYGWPVAHVLGVPALGYGIGGLVRVATVGADPVGPIVVLVAGAAALAVRPVLTRWWAVRRRRQDWARMHGTVVIGEVTATNIVAYDGVDHWTATVRFTDAQGRQRWAKGRLRVRQNPQPRVGDRCTVRYDPEHPGRRSSIHIDLRRPVRSRSAQNSSTRAPGSK